MSEISDLCDRAVEQRADANPLMATYIGAAGRDHRWPDLSPAGYTSRRELDADLRRQAEAVTVNGEVEELARRVLIDDLTLEIEHYDRGAWRRDLNSIASPFQAVKGVFELMGKESAEDWRNIASRLESIDEPLAGHRESLGAGRAAGDVVARRQVDQVVAESRATAGEDSVFYALLESAGDGLSDELRDRLARAVEHANASVLAFADWLESDYAPSARSEDAFGAEAYVQEARRFLGMTIVPLETYAWGWKEYERLRERLADVCAQIDPDRSPAEVIDLLATDPARAAASAEEFLGVMQTRQETALEQLAGVHFDVPAEIHAIAVKQSPPGGALAPYYTQPSEDFVSRPGTVWYPLDGKTTFPLFQEVTTAHHEGFPGHHLQVGVQMCQGDLLSRYHKLIVWLPGAGEGWALYAEHLMGELGYLDPPDYEVGLLTSQLMRAARVVIDIGLHLELDIPETASFHPGEPWTFELGVEMLEKGAYQDHAMAVSEINRYLGWPGQAISYKIGEREILDLRRIYVDELGGTLKDFHNRVLGVGSIGLDLLRELVLAS